MWGEMEAKPGDQKPKRTKKNKIWGEMGAKPGDQKTSTSHFVSRVIFVFGFGPTYVCTR